MHSFPWWGELLINAFILLSLWQTWVVLGLLVVGFVLWKKRNKSP